MFLSLGPSFPNKMISREVQWHTVASFSIISQILTGNKLFHPFLKTDTISIEHANALWDMHLWDNAYEKQQMAILDKKWKLPNLNVVGREETVVQILTN